VRRCPNDHEVHAGAAFCPRCGARAGDASDDAGAQPPELTRAAGLRSYIGWARAHKEGVGTAAAAAFVLVIVTAAVASRSNGERGGGAGESEQCEPGVYAGMCTWGDLGYRDGAGFRASYRLTGESPEQYCSSQTILLPGITNAQADEYVAGCLVSARQAYADLPAS
jgi:hypothetical protein